ncbi:hypothetical protein EDD27_4526 [Nonomuraea polychroma]|uniref:Uncharacterized protein n=1 Tax=Nonomuraea polychroma TaxID=46176 RepID=A0A438M864_9ACTN|nr:hypothetical protein [Nonomuraea polychroma]RVX41921.1 hypothetical protein EDD27_4526 [Nonomuraea polychroma]
MTSPVPSDRSALVDAHELKPGDVVEIHKMGKDALTIGRWTVLPATLINGLPLG